MRHHLGVYCAANLTNNFAPDASDGTQEASVPTDGLNVDSDLIQITELSDVVAN